MNQLELIIAQLPAEVRASPSAVADATSLLNYCAGAIVGATGWPDSGSLEELRDLSQGYGCWLDELQEAIASAPLPEADRDLWSVALSSARGIVHIFYFEKRRQAISGGSAA